MLFQIAVFLASAPKEIPLGPIQGPKDNKLDVAGGMANINAANLSILFNSVVSFLIGFMTVLAGLFFLFQVFLAAISWLNAGGNEKNVTDAKAKLMNSLIGLVVVVAAYAAIGLVSQLLGLDILKAPLAIFPETK